MLTAGFSLVGISDLEWRLPVTSDFDQHESRQFIERVRRDQVADATVRLILHPLVYVIDNLFAILHEVDVLQQILHLLLQRCRLVVKSLGSKS